MLTDNELSKKVNEVMNSVSLDSFHLEGALHAFKDLSRVELCQVSTEISEEATRRAEIHCLETIRFTNITNHLMEMAFARNKKRITDPN